MKIIRMLDFPKIAKLENFFVLNAPNIRTINSDIQGKLDVASQEIFESTINDTYFDAPEDYESIPEGTKEHDDLDYEWETHEGQYAIVEGSPRDQVEALMALGFDFRDDSGLPMRITEHFCRQAIAAAKGSVGRMPDTGEVDLAHWEKSLRTQSQHYMAGRKRR